VPAAHARARLAPTEPAGDDWQLRSGDVTLRFGARTSLAHRLEASRSRAPAAAGRGDILRVAARATAAAHLRRGGGAPIELGDGSLAIGADRAHGTALVFV